MLTLRAPPQVKALLFGLPNSTLKLHMRRQDGSSCDVTAMRQALTKKKCCLLCDAMRVGWLHSRGAGGAILLAMGGFKVDR